MSGHSKWATIHRDKEVNDSKRGAVFTKLAHAITVAARQKEEYKLRLVIEKARSMNMPKDNIARAIDRATSEEEGLEEVLFEGFGPGGVAILIEGLTNNRLRFAQEVRTILEKSGGRLGSTGSVSHLFDHLGEIKILKLKSLDNDSQMLQIIDIGAEDIVDEINSWIIYCHKDHMHDLKTGLEKAGYRITSLALIYRAIISVSGDNIDPILSKLDDLDDVTQIWTNDN